MVLDFQFRTIQLNRLNWRDFIGQPNPVASALMAKMGIAPVDRPKVKLECLRLLATLRLDRERARLIARFVDTYLRLTADEQQLFQVAFVAIAPCKQEAVMEITTSWKEEGIQEGIAFGLEQGLEQGQRALLKRQLARRFGALPAELDAAIDTLATPQREALGEALLDFAALAELGTWLHNASEPDATK